MPSLFRKKTTTKSTRLFFATDLHASERAFRKFINAAKFYDVDVLVLGGDVVGKLIVPILRDERGHYRALFGDRMYQCETLDELKKLQEQLGMMGYYYCVMDEEEFHIISKDGDAVSKLFHELARERLTAWIEFADTRLKADGTKCFVMGGNDDAPDILQVLYEARSEWFLPCEDRVVLLDTAISTSPHTMLSLGYSTPTPWHTPREISDELLGDKIDGLVSQVPDVSRCIFNLHDPPIDSSLDVCARLDDGDPPRHILKGGRPVMHNAGSSAVRRAIEKYHPLLSLHGHIHESPGVIRIGRTLCINPGSEYSEGILCGAIVNIKDGQIEGYQLTTG